jgi:PPOX class probable F420-dependent enzyme
MVAIPQEFVDLFAKRAFADLATIRSDGMPHVSPLWVDYDGTHVRFNSAKGRAKVKHIARDPRVTLNIRDPENPYRYLEIRGRVVETTEQGADAHIDALAKKYLGKEKYPFRQPGEVRVLFKVVPEYVHGRS